MALYYQNGEVSLDDMLNGGKGEDVKRNSNPRPLKGDVHEMSDLPSSSQLTVPGFILGLCSQEPEQPHFLCEKP